MPLKVNIRTAATQTIVNAALSLLRRTSSIIVLKSHAGRTFKIDAITIQINAKIILFLYGNIQGDISDIRLLDFLKLFIIFYDSSSDSSFWFFF
jgi:hypothetical protein